MKVREPVARPLDVVAVELLLSASQAFLVGVLMYLAVGIWDDRGVGFGPVAAILGLLGLAIGSSWLYWLFGGVGWPLAAANTPAVMFLGFALVLGWSGEDLFRVPGVPLLLATASAAYGILGGAFIDSPRRWRWDQRQKLRPGTRVPRVSPTTRALVAQMPRSLPRRRGVSVPARELAARIEHSTPAGQPAPAGVGGPQEEPGAPAAESGDSASARGPRVSPPGAAGTATPPSEATGSGEADGADGAASGSGATASADHPGGGRPASRPRSASRAAAVRRGRTADDADGIELPASVEPRAQRSPWAWAAPPEWTRDEDDEAPRGHPRERP